MRAGEAREPNAPRYTAIGAGDRPPGGGWRWLRPRPAAILSLVIVLVLVALLTLEAYVDSEFRPDSSPAGVNTTGDVPTDIASGGSIIDTTNGRTTSYRLPAGTIALTFDDGPDPQWTPAIREVLAKHHVPATFFVVGSQVARYPDLVRDLVDDGHEVGIHTFTHPDMAVVPRWRRTLEYSQTQMAIAAATGVKTALLRFPYSSRADALTDETWPLVVQAGQEGYLTIVTDTDSQDWREPGVAQVVANATPADGAGATVLLHDAGGDRSQTVAALDVLIPRLQAQGYRFVTVSQGLDLALASASQLPAARTVPETTVAATALEQWRGRALVWTVQFADAVFNLFGVFILIAGGLMVARTALLFILAGHHARRRRRPDWSWGEPVTVPVSVVIPANNERENIAAAVTSIAQGDYPEIEVVVVDDGSTDGTGAIVKALRLPNVRVIRVANGGKSSALNIGIAAARHDLIIMVDGDTVFEPTSIRALVQPFADAGIGAVAGNVKVSNRRSLIGQWQHVEYVIGFNLDRRLYEVLGCMPTVPGAIGAYRRQALVDVGGVSDRTLAEDTDLTMAITRAGWRIAYEPKAVAHTEAPATLRQLWRQRYRWSYGTMQAMWIHRGAVTESGASGRFGRVGLPFLALFSIALPLLAPLIDLMTIYGVLFRDRAEAGLAWLAMLALQVVTALVAFRLDREPAKSIWTLPLHQFVYRQLVYLIMVKSIVTAFTGVRLRWQKLQRIGAAAAHHDRTAIRIEVGPGPTPAKKELVQAGGGTSANAASVRSA
jgi:peptidoglycan/xylan/chitin deacetylase (PgdA/CDA1 family)/glycosyltransferase involved in cell wall biosynthesis